MNMMEATVFWMVTMSWVQWTLACFMNLLSANLPLALQTLEELLQELVLEPHDGDNYTDTPVAAMSL